MPAWGAYLLAVALAFCALPAGAAGAEHSPPLSSQCHAVSSLDEPLARIVADPARWRCGEGEPPAGAERVVLRFAPSPGEPPRYFATRPLRFSALTLMVVQHGKVTAQSRYRANEVAAGPQGTFFLLPLPAHRGPAEAVLVAIDGPSSRAIFSAARLHARDPALGHGAMVSLLLAAIVCGMLIMPLAFNAAYYRVLRERFVFWHLALSSALLAQCLLTSGIVAHLITLPLPVHTRLVVISFGIGVAAATGFCAAFIEPDKLDQRLRKALYFGAAYSFVTSLLHAFVPTVLGTLQTTIFYASFIPLLVLYGVVMRDAWKRGSRAVRYLLVGWAPFILMGVIRIGTMLNPWFQQNEAVPLFYMAMVIESIAISLGVADRFMIIKRERDRALIRAQSLEHLSERDDLTGLYNRRALDGRLGDFAVQRFTGFALFDLDNFKRVNDTKGHAVGDAVLRTVATVLDGHEDAVALRLGGEEFLLLLHGPNVSERVERVREAIPVRIAREVTELEILVTASTGLVEAAPGEDIGSDFVGLYRQADDLLYEAKHHGRNLLAAVMLKPERRVGAAGEVAAA